MHALYAARVGVQVCLGSMFIGTAVPSDKYNRSVSLVCTSLAHACTNTRGCGFVLRKPRRSCIIQEA
jgi:hypothetical protein